jgi:hypothetical protein
VRVTHAPATKTECPTYACTLPVEAHERPDDDGQTWHHDDSTGTHWPTDPVSAEQTGE